MSLLVPPIPGCTIMNGISKGRSGVMSTQSADSRGLHLPDLVIKGFRGIEDLSISRLGRVNLISGKNGVGKTTLLEAVRVYAARGRHLTMASILHTREEVVSALDYDGGNETLGPDWTSLFYGRDTSSISIGPKDKSLRLNIEADHFEEEWSGKWRGTFARYYTDEKLRLLSIGFQNSEHRIPMIPLTARVLNEFGTQLEYSLPSQVVCEVLGPGLPSNEEVARYWDSVALTEEETRAVQALNLIFRDIERVAVIGAGATPSGASSSRIAHVKLKGVDTPVSLKSLGDGAVRLFGVALALANSRNGFLLIDEVENGIHYSLQHDFWKMVMQTAYENNVQVFATTHSWDCVRGFAWAALETELPGSRGRVFGK